MRLSVAADGSAAAQTSACCSKIEIPVSNAMEGRMDTQLFRPSVKKSVVFAEVLIFAVVVIIAAAILLLASARLP